MGSPRDLDWVEGLRGLAAMFVMTTHLWSGFGQLVDKSYLDWRYAWFKLPFLANFVVGLPSVQMFLVLTGYVNALKAIQSARNGRPEEALSGLASSCLRRASRLMLPCTIATLLCWILAEVGAFKMGFELDSKWMKETCPLPSPSLYAGLLRPFRAVMYTWTLGGNELERNQWVMWAFLKGSFSLYVALLALVRATSTYRMLMMFGLILFGIQAQDTLVFIPVFTGALLAECSMTSRFNIIARSRTGIHRVVTWTLVILGLYLIGVPMKYEPDRLWPKFLFTFGTFFLYDARPFLVYFAVLLVLVGVMLSQAFQKGLSHPYLRWLGVRSFPIYLIHGPILRSVLTWMIFIGANADAHEGKTTATPKTTLGNPSTFRLCAALAVFLVIVFALSDIWSRWVEAWCDAMTQRLEILMCGQKNEKHSQSREGLLPQ